jgi:hypothetical protein
MHTKEDCEKMSKMRPIHKFMLEYVNDRMLDVEYPYIIQSINPLDDKMVLQYAAYNFIQPYRVVLNVDDVEQFKRLGIEYFRNVHPSMRANEFFYVSFFYDFVTNAVVVFRPRSNTLIVGVISRDEMLNSDNFNIRNPGFGVANVGDIDEWLQNDGTPFLYDDV